MGKYQPLCASVLSSLKRRAQLHCPWPLQPSFPCCCYPDFCFPLCLRILRVPAPGTAALGNLPKGLLLLLCPTPVLLDWVCLCATQGRQQCRVQGRLPLPPAALSNRSPRTPQRWRQLPRQQRIGALCVLINPKAPWVWASASQCKSNPEHPLVREPQPWECSC